MEYVVGTVAQQVEPVARDSGLKLDLAAQQGGAGACPAVNCTGVCAGAISGGPVREAGTRRLSMPKKTYLTARGPLSLQEGQ